jgi:tryptophan synthase alpha chain
MCFEDLRSRGERALVVFLTAGFPTPSATAGLLQAIARGGADIIELGVPFSDPIADGPTIQRASAEAIAAGTTLPGVLDMVRQFRTVSEVPVVLFGAYNPFLHYGLERFAADATAAGADGVLIPDLPVDEGEEVEPQFRTAGLDLIYLAAPTTPPGRKRLIASRASGFVYYISVKGVTGARSAATFDLERPIADLREGSTLPIAVGFGISTPEQAAAVARFADGVVVGSAIVDLVSRNRAATDMEAQVEGFVASLKASLRASTGGA